MLNSTAYKFLSNLVEEKPIYFATGVVLGLTSAALNIISTILLIPIILLVFDARSFNNLPHSLGIFDFIFNFVNNIPENNRLIVILLFLCCAIAIKNCLTYIDSIFNIKHKNFLSYKLKSKGIDILCRINIDYYHKNKIGDTLLKLNREIDRSIINLISRQKIYILLIIILAFTLLLIFVSWQLTFIGLLLLWSFKIVNSFIVTKTKTLEQEWSQKSKMYTGKLIEFLTGIEFIKTVASETEENLKIDRALKEKEKYQLKSQILSSVINPLNELMGLIVIVFLTFAASYLYELPVQKISPTILIYLAFLFRLLPFINQLNKARTQFERTIVSAETITNFLTESNHKFVKSGMLPKIKANPSIKFENITFAYPNHGQIVLDKVNLYLNQGENTAILGTSQVEKSAIIELLIRFYEPIEGKIAIACKDIKEYNLISLRKSTAIISNNIFLFNNSLAYNIAYGLENISEAEMIAAVKKADLDNFIAQLPHGLATEIGVRGYSLSESQKQKIAIARAILRNPEILIVDESNIAPEILAQPVIEQAIAELCCDRTTLTITQRLSTIESADRVIVFNKGVAIESGTHAELLDQGDFYNRWYSMQFKTSQQSHQQQLAKKIAKKLARQTNGQLSTEISQNLDELLSYMHLINEGAFQDDTEQEKIIDESYQSAKDMLANLKEYERKIAREFGNE